MGGNPAGEIDRENHDFALWEKRVDALLILSSDRGHMTVHGLRRALEDLGEEAFETMTYYERWISSISQNLVEAGVFTLEELGEKMREISERGTTYGEATSG